MPNTLSQTALPSAAAKLTSDSELRTVHSFRSNTGKHTQLRLQLSQLLQSSLELPAILDIFFQGVQPTVTLAGLRYEHNQLPQAISCGEIARHSVRYTLSVDDSTLGSISCSSHRRFSQNDLQSLEILLSTLINPLRNALLYRAALQSASRDPLTGVSNRAALEQALQREIALAQRHQRALSLLVVDIDHFKAINDRHGHAGGDAVLKNVASALGQACRDTDELFRFGGEEFVIVLQDTAEADAQRVAERLRLQVESATTEWSDQKIAVTISVGVATLKGDESRQPLFERADRALYRAKAAGRNRVEVAEQGL